MTLFKKLTDFCAGIVTFVCGLFLLQKYMIFKPLDDLQYIQYINDKIEYSKLPPEEAVTEAASKFTQFLDPDIIGYDYRLSLILLIVLAVSIAVGIIAKKLPYICFFTSLFPAVGITYLFTHGLINTQTGLFLLGGALHIAGNVYECIVRDREDGRHRLWICAKISLMFPSLLCLFFTKICEHVPIENIDARVPIFKELAFKMTKPENMEYVTKIGWMFLIIFVITTVLYNVYFIDAILSAIPLGYTIYLLYSENLTFNPAIFTVLAAICFMTHIALCICENNLSRKEQMRLKAEQEKAE